MVEGEVTLKIKEVLGTAIPFAQGGSWRLTIPKRVASRYGLERPKGEPYISFVFVDTDKGILLLPLTKLVNLKTLESVLM